MAKKYLTMNVYDALQKRLEFIFNEFDNVLVSFSGGKDSGVLLNLCYDYAKKHNLLSKLAVYHLDYEAQYDFTTRYVTETFEHFADIKRYWLCLPVAAQCACRMDGGSWMPNFDYIINEDNCPFNVVVGKDDTETQDDFVKWFISQYGTTALMVGIRSDESYDRYKLIKSTSKNLKKYKGIPYIVDSKYKDFYRCYPIYDWSVEDIWVANSKFGFNYNRLYDLYYQAGMTINQMRVASPFNDCALDTLKFYKVIEPTTWGKLVSRVNGVSFAGIYGGTTAMGWKSITKPKHMTWKEYCYFLLNTLDDKTKQHYLDKLNTSLKFWKEKGGALSEETVNEITSVPYINKGKVSPISEKDVIAFEEYPDDLPEVTNFKEVPTYKRMCVCILKNDYFCKYMGFAQTKEEVTKRRAAINKYKMLL